METGNCSDVPVSCDLVFWCDHCQSSTHHVGCPEAGGDTDAGVWLWVCMECESREYRLVAVGSGGDAPGQIVCASYWLRGYLRWGPVPADTVLTDAREAGLHERTLRTVKALMGVVSVKQGESWWWVAPWGAR